MKTEGNTFTRSTNRRAFFKKGAVAAGAATLGGSLRGNPFAFGQDQQDSETPITRGDIAILRFLSAAEQIEADLWTQYSELGGTQDNEVSGVNGGNPLYTAALQILDGDMPQYIHDNTDDELSHHQFLNNFLESKGAKPVDLSHFATIPGSTAAGSTGKHRLTNLMQLTIDTSFWSRYRSITNPDFDPGAPFVQAVPSLNVKQHTAIPRTNADTDGSSLSSDNTKSITAHLQAIAFTAGFHFAFIEVGGTSLYPTLAQKVTNLEVLRILLSIRPQRNRYRRRLPRFDRRDRFLRRPNPGARRNEPPVFQRRYFAGEPDDAGALPFSRRRFGSGGHYWCDLNQAQRRRGGDTGLRG